MAETPVRELRVALTVPDFRQALRFYRDAFGLPVLEEWDRDDGSGAVLDAGRATIELLSEDQAASVDEIEAGRRGVSGPVRLALEVEDSAATARRLAAGGAELVADPVVTPWRHRNVRLRAPDGMQLTLFTVLDEDGDG
jgi:catechol 2,3-dioxygenase-like lactoylglutathione lyase family enzyme